MTSCFPCPGQFDTDSRCSTEARPHRSAILSISAVAVAGRWGFQVSPYQPTAAFGFDRIEFSGTVESIQDSDLNYHTSLQLSPSPLQLTYFLAPAVPEPSSSLLVLGGLIATGFWCRRLRRADEHRAAFTHA
jgi:hypothetical protein